MEDKMEWYYTCPACRKKHFYPRRLFYSHWKYFKAKIKQMLTQA